MLDAAIWQELSGEKANDIEVHHTLGTFLSRWLLARSQYPQAFCKSPGVCRPTGTFLVAVASEKL
jgi:hypothetical protein